MKHFIITIFFLKILLAVFAQNDVIIEAANLQIEPENEITYPITINPNGNSVAAFNLEIEYDNNVIESLDIEGADDWSVASNDDTPGIIRAVGFNFKGQNTTFQAVNIKFNAIGRAGQTSPILLNVEFVTDKNGEYLSYINSNGSILIDGCNSDVIGIACNDYDDCTTNDTYNLNCECAGIFQDADNDGLCDALDNCPNLDNNQIGNTCDDGDICTTEDVLTNSCICEGIYQDEDNDGICDALEVEQEPTLTQCNIIQNHDFSNGQQNWDAHVSSSASASLNTNKGYADFTIANGSTKRYKVQLLQTGIHLEQGKTYEVSFKAKSAISKTIYIIISNRASDIQYNYKSRTIEANWSTIKYNFTMNNSTDNNSRISFGVGQNSTDISIDDVILKESDCATCAIGSTCDDGNSCTDGDIITNDCECVGNQIRNCNTCRYTDSLALVTIYQSLNGQNLPQSKQWDFTKPMDTWYGVGLNENGCVQQLHIYEENLSGQIPAAIGDLKEIVSINLSENEITGYIPEEIGQLVNLEILSIGTNKMYDPIPTSIENLTKLEKLYIHQNQFSTLPDAIGKLTNLTRLGLNGNLFKNIPASIGDLKNLQRLNVGQNELTEIPASIGDLNDLTILVLANNQLTNIPNSIGNLKLLSHLFLEYNSLLNLPETTSDLINLTHLYAQYNELKNLPQSIGNLTKLEFLRLDHNAIEMLPSSIRNLDNLSTFYINDNQIKGQLPVSLAEMDKLFHLSIQNNQMSGCYDKELEKLCYSLPSYNVSNKYISNGNKFDISWEEFCSGSTCKDNKISKDQHLAINNQPNPFTHNTKINYTLNTNTKVSISIYDAVGKQITILLNDKDQKAGKHSILFDGNNLSAGVYYYHIQSTHFNVLQKMILLK